MSNAVSEETMTPNLAELSRKTGLVVRPLDSAVGEQPVR